MPPESANIPRAAAIARCPGNRPAYTRNGRRLDTRQGCADRARTYGPASEPISSTTEQDDRGGDRAPSLGVHEAKSKPILARSVGHHPTKISGAYIIKHILAEPSGLNYWRKLESWNRRTNRPAARKLRPTPLRLPSTWGEHVGAWHQQRWAQRGRKASGHVLWTVVKNLLQKYDGAPSKLDNGKDIKT